MDSFIKTLSEDTRICASCAFSTEGLNLVECPECESEDWIYPLEDYINLLENQKEGIQ